MSSSTVSDTHFMNTKIDRVVVIEKMNSNEAIRFEIGLTNNSLLRNFRCISLMIVRNMNIICLFQDFDKLIHLRIT